MVPNSIILLLNKLKEESFNLISLYNKREAEFQKSRVTKGRIPVNQNAIKVFNDQIKVSIDILNQTATSLINELTVIKVDNIYLKSLALKNLQGYQTIWQYPNGSPGFKSLVFTLDTWFNRFVKPLFI